MTYSTLERIEQLCGREVADEVARDYVLAEREHVARLVEAIDSEQGETT